MLNMRGYMNELTRRIKAKGYTLAEGVKALGLSLSTHRKYEKESHPQHANLVLWIDELENKNNGT
jgi:transcriptional regulator with XRE-family HTH domain